MPLNQVLLATTDNNQLNFQSMFQVDPKYIAQAIAMAQVFQGAINGDNLEFDFTKALELVQQSGMAESGTLYQKYVQDGNNPVSVTVDKLMSLLSSVAGVVLDKTSDTYKQFEGAIQAGFSNLEKQEGSAWFFWNKTTENMTMYTYNCLFAVQNAKTGSVMAACPIALTIEVDKAKKDLLFITLQDKANYSIVIKCITVFEELRG